MNSAIRRSIWAALICAAVMLPFSDAFAISVSIDKPHVDVNVEPGESAIGSIIVKNNSDSPITVGASIEDWIYNDKGEKEFKMAGTTPLSCAGWVEVTPRSAMIPAKGNGAFSYVVRVPQDAVGGHYAVIFFESSEIQTDPSKGSNVKIVGRIGSTIYQQTKGKYKKTGSVISAEIIQPKKNEPLTYTYKFKNEGDCFIRI
ncbi:MAG: hypothetical protein PHT32_08495, partial [Candidatus Omnitrophica bacterium]|nr:hypothetical protein [Candidatus Omnitrophota bacterium]